VSLDRAITATPSRQLGELVVGLCLRSIALAALAGGLTIAALALVS
jgi:hypothetical protein